MRNSVLHYNIAFPTVWQKTENPKYTNADMTIENETETEQYFVPKNV